MHIQITSATWNPASAALDVVSAITGVSALEGTCTVSAENGSATLTQAGSAVFDGKGMSCGTIAIPLPSGSSGVWTVTVSFVGGDETATSEPTKITVP
ncbi:hypothetical protein GCM10027298_35090 [Epidermidibacterium keratini]